MIVELLEDFGPVSTHTADLQGATEEHRLGYFEEGYSAGWEDAVNAQSENTKIATEAFAKSLTDLSFTYHEAVNAIAVTLTPLLTGMVEKVLPDILDASIAALVSERLQAILAEQAQVDVIVTCSTFRGEILKDALPDDLSLPVRIMSDPNIARDCVRLSFSDREEQLDLGEISTSIQDAVSALTFQIKKDFANG